MFKMFKIFHFMVLRVSLKYFLFVEDFALGKNLEMIESLRIINLIHEYIE